MKTKNTNTPEQNMNAAIIGYWRNGMTHEQIRLATDLTNEQINNIIWNYLNSKKMTPEERQKHLADLPNLMFAIHGILKNGERDACLCVSEKDFENEKKKFDVFVKYKLVKDE